MNIFALLFLSLTKLSESFPKKYLAEIGGGNLSVIYLVGWTSPFQRHFLAKKYFK